MSKNISTTQFLFGGGQLTDLIKEHGWSTTPLGPVDLWPQSLKTTVSLMLNSQHPMWVGWGPEATFLYNDAYINVLSLAKHPWALGRPASVVWSEIWDVCGPLADRVFRNGEASFQDDVRLFMRRTDYIEEVFYSFSYSPIRDESGEVGGLFCPSAETTGKVIGARRLSTLSELAAKALLKGTVEEACQSSLDTIALNPDDIPFALLFLDSFGGLTLQAVANFPDIEALKCPTMWFGGEVLASGLARTLNAPISSHLPIGLAEQPIRQVRVLPVRASTQEAPLGVLVTAISPARQADSETFSFLNLVSGQIATAIRNARVAEETRMRAENLAKLDLAKTTFFSNISHELRTPLTLMLGPLGELAEGGAGQMQSRELAVLALRNGHRLHKLVNTLLDFSRIEAGRMTASFVPTDLALVTSELASAFQSAFDSSGVEYTIACSEPLLPVYVDRDMWEKIVLNLISNALKYTMSGEVSVKLKGNENGVTLQVRDSGVGIPEYELPRLFERFHRIEGRHGRTNEGTGIGLAFVQELVKLHGGKVSVFSRQGQGSTFEVWLPTGCAHLPLDQIKQQLHQGERSGAEATFIEEAMGWIGDTTLDEPLSVAVSGRQARIVLADDNADMRAYIARMLRSQGHVVITVNDGLQALEAVRSQSPDLLLTDVMMPGLDGFGVLQAIREFPIENWFPVIMLSARAGEEARIEGLRAGADDYLVKPFSARELTARVSSILAISLVRREALLAEKRLRQEVVAILESIREGFCALDRDFRFTYVNAEAERMQGINRKEILGRGQFEVYPESRGTALENAFIKVRDDRIPVHLENYYAPWDRWFELNCYPIELESVGVYFRDITDRKKADMLARQTEQRKDEFIATLAHELRNPLAPVRAGLKILALDPSKEIAERTHKMMDRQVKQMVRLIDDLMDVSRISKGKVDLRKERVTLQQVCKTALETSRPLLDAGKHHVVLSLPHEPVWLFADETRMSQAISNLLNNAAKYTPESGRVTLAAQRVEDTVCIEVTDTGTGIDSKLLPTIFDMFVQGDATLHRAQGGLGIGLTLVKQLVNLHGGEVFAKSEGPGKGSVFTVVLPMEELSTGISSHVSGDMISSTRLKVLVVDDNVDAAQTLSMLLESLGYDCIPVYNGHAAIEAYNRFIPDVVFLDLGMPGMSGYEVVKKLRQHEGKSRAYLCALTGWGSPSDQARSRAAGFDAHLTKPIDLPELQTALSAAALLFATPELKVI